MRRRRIGLFSAALWALLALSPAAVRSAPPGAGEPDAPTVPVETLTIANDHPIEVVVGPNDSPHVMIYMHGVCGNPFAFKPWAAAAAKHGTLIALRGDAKCSRKPWRMHWTYDFARNDRRITAAIAVVDALRKARAAPDQKVATLDADHPVLVGYSQGARRAEWLAAKFPDRYKRVALIGTSAEPSALRLAGTEAVLLMVGTRDVREHVRSGRDALEKAGKRVNYIELPGAAHGEYGPHALRVMGQGLDWLFRKVP